MIQIMILGLQEGVYPFSVTSSSQSIEGILPEFIGDTQIIGTIKRQGKRILISAEAVCKALLLCDISGEEFTDIVKAQIILHYVIDTQLFYLQPKTENDDEGEILIREEDTYIDISDEVRQQLALNLPMKRISPLHSQTSFEDLYPERSTEKQKTEPNLPDETSPWAALKDIKIVDN